ncbi:MAG TPA: lipocalin-like domain-containing protein [Acidobacteriota bacterium]|nr:lipocalin-like domain-containing protein [Acidobacteriota bacterium]
MRCKGLFHLSRLVLLTAVAFAPLASASDFRQAAPGYSWSFPRDHWAHHDYRIEWWYFTGHLKEAGSEDYRFGYQFTFYRIGLTPETPPYDSAWATSSMIMGHAALTDLQSGQHVFSELVYRTTPFLGGFPDYPDPLVAWSRAPAGSDARWELRFNGEAFDFSARDDAQGIALDLSTRPAKPLVLQGPNGYSSKGPGAASASLYYTFPRLDTSGSVVFQGERFQVTGQSWMDKEFSTSVLSQEQVGWDWFSLQFQDGAELMLFQLRRRDGSPDFGRATFIDSDGRPRFLDLKEWTLTPTESWTSPESDAPYPVAWTLRVPSLDLDLKIESLLKDQENRSLLVPDLNYYEGAVRVTTPAGTPRGRGFAELTGYGPNSRPPI